MSLILKQLYINSLYIPQDIHDLIKQYVFYDRYQMNLRNNLKLCFHSIINSDKTRFDNVEHWTISLPDIQFQACNCSVCGGYTFTNDSALLMALNSRTLCSCDDFLVIHSHNASILGYLYNPNTGRYEYNIHFDINNNHIGQLEDFDYIEEHTHDNDYLEFIMEYDEFVNEHEVDQVYRDWINGPNHDDDYEVSYFDY